MHTMRLLLFQKQEGRCWLCGECMDLFLPSNTWGACSWEHIIPLAHGGSIGWKNVAMTHHECNKARGNRFIWKLTRPKSIRELKRPSVERLNRQFQHQVVQRLKPLFERAALAD